MPTKKLFYVLAALGAATLAGCSGYRGQSVPAAAMPQSVAPAEDVAAKIAAGEYIRACRHPVLGRWRCFALGLRDLSQAPWSADAGNGSVRGYGPAELQAAYNITDAAKKNRGGLIAVVEYGGYPELEHDLAVYRRHFGLPPCDSASNCLKIVNEHGNRNHLPPVDKEWLSEQAIDVDMVSANCPNCRILVVQATTSLFKAELTAARAHPVAISNSWGSFEYPQERRAVKRVFDHPGIAITASAGDFGYGTTFPAAASTVTAVGGTFLQRADNKRGYKEIAWGNSAGGCSRYIAPPAWQVPIEQQLGGCSNRIIGDVSYDASPRSGMAIYESRRGDGERPGWQVWGGTSAGTPAIAAIYALSGKTADIPAQLAYSHSDALHDIVKGVTGTCATPYLCTAEVGYDAPTGNGSPDGLGAF